MNYRIIIICLVALLAVSACSAKTDPAPSPASPADSVATVVTQQVTFLELGSKTCIPCKMMQPVLKAIAKEYAGKVKVEFHDLADDREIRQKYRVRVMPTQIFLNSEGQEFFRHEGFYPQEDITKMLNEYFASKISPESPDSEPPVQRR